MAKKQHITFRQAVRSLADAGWGQQFESQTKAQEHLINNSEELTSYALLDIVRRFNTAIRALANDGKQEDYDKPDVEKPEDAKVFPGAKLGDTLYSMSDGDLSRQIIVRVCDGGFVRTVYSDQSYAAGKTHVHWGTEGDYATLKEAVDAYLADSDEEHYRHRLSLHAELRDAMGAGDDAKIAEVCERF